MDEEKHHEIKDTKKESDDEISLDFTKVKDFFKRIGEKSKERLASEEKKPEEKTDEASDEISIDFKKVRNFFRGIKISGDKKDAAEKDEKDEEISINWKPFINFMKRYGFFFVLLIPVLLSIYIRMLPESIPATDRWASDAVYNNIRSNMKQQLDQQYPNLPEANKNELVRRQMDNFVSQNKREIDAQVKATSDFFKQHFKDENSRTYMPDIDPYYWVRYAENVLEKGHPADEIIDGRGYDTYQLAPIGRVVRADVSYHATFLAYFHRFASIFAPKITVIRSASYYPVFVSALCVLLAFLIGRKIAGNVGGFFSALMLSANSTFIGRTLFGHADSDAWVVFFPLFATYMFIEALDSKSVFKNSVFSVIAGISIGLFSQTWSGWWFIFDFLLMAAGIYIIYLMILEFIFNKKEANIVKFLLKPEIRNMVIASLIFFFVALIMVTWIHDFGVFSVAAKPFGFSKIKDPVTPSLWPNVLTTVAELNPGSYNQVVNSMGGKFLWFIGILGILLALLRRDNKGRLDIRFTFLLGLWLAASTWSTLLGIRFSLLVAPAFSIAFGTALGMSYRYVSRWATKGLHIHKAISGSILILIFLMLYINPINASMSAAQSDIPLVNDAWYNSLNFIKSNSTENAIITSWWDFGHHFKLLADRRVTFDGTTQTNQAAHWVGRLFSTSDEKEAVGILRMLDCGNKRAYDAMEGRFNVHKTTRILKEIILLNKEQASKRLKQYGLEDIQVSNITSFTHCNPPEAYIIASDDMIGKSGVWGHFGAWNFERADIYFNARKMDREEGIKYMMDNFNYTEEKADSIYSEVQSITNPSDGNAWVAPWPGYGGVSGCNLNDDNTTLECDNGFLVNLTNYEIHAESQQGKVHPRLFAYFDEKDSIKIKRYNESTVNIGATLIKKDSSYSIVMTSPELTGGMFTRMFFMEGKGLNRFELVEHQKGITGTEIYVYKVRWPSG